MENKKKAKLSNLDDSLVSIVIPAHNAASVIEDSIESILNQTYRNIEIIVVNNGSVDDTADVVLRFSKIDNRVRLVNSDRTGVSHARNVGIEEARGEYIVFCDADDLMESKAVSTLLSQMEAADVTAGGMAFDCIDENRKVLSSSTRQVDAPIRVRGTELRCVFECLWDRNYLLSCWSKLYSVEFIKKNGVRFDERLGSYEDLIFVLDLISHGAVFVAIPEICYRYLRLPVGTSSSKYMIDKTDQMERVAGRVLTFYEDTLDEGWTAKCNERLIQFLVIAINNAQMTPRGGKPVIDQIADVFSRAIFSDAAEYATRYPNAYSCLLIHLGRRRRYRAVAVLAAIRNAIRSRYASR